MHTVTQLIIYQLPQVCPQFDYPGHSREGPADRGGKYKLNLGHMSDVGEFRD